MGGWNLPQSKWANPFKVSDCESVEVAIAKFEAFVRADETLMSSLHELKGKVLGCWCKKTPTSPCHGDVLVKMVNELE